MKKLTALMLAVLMILSTAVFTVSAQEDITAGTTSFALNKNTIVTSRSKVAGNSDGNFVVLGKGGYAEYIVHTEKAAEYQLILYVGGKKAGIYVDATVNGVLAVDNKELIVTNGYQTYTDNTLGNITLRPGENRIVITNDTTSADSIVTTTFRLAYVADAEYAPMSYQLNTDTVADYSHAWVEQCAQNYITLNRSATTQYVDYTIPSAKAGSYTLSVNSGGKTAGILMNVSVGGTLQLENAEFPEVTGDYQKWADQMLGTITLAEGENVIRFSMPTESTSAAVMRYFTITRLAEVAEDITSDPAVFLINQNTADISHADAKNSNDNYATMQNGQYIEYTINTLKEAAYLLTFTCSTNKGSSGTMDVSNNGTLVLDDAPLKDTGGHSDAKRMANDLGVIHLKPGKNVLKFQVSGTAAVATKLELRAFTEQITGKSTEFALNKNTTQNFDGASADYYADCIALWEGKSVEYVVTTEKAGDYGFALKVGTLENVNVNMSISVNGEKVLTPSITDGTGYGNRTYHNFGAVTLKNGTNVIKISNDTTTHTAAVVTHFKLAELKEDITANPMVFPLNNTTVDLTHANPANSTVNYATMQNGQYIEYTVNTKKNSYYLLTLTAGTGNDTTGLSVFMNGNLVLDKALLANTGSYSTRVPHELGLIYLPVGENILKFQTSGGAVVSTQFALEKKRLDQTITVNGASGEQNVNISEAGVYGVTAKVTSADNGVVRVSANGTTVAGDVNGAGDVFVGNIYLDEGVQNVKVTTSGNAQIASVLLSDKAYDLSEEITSKTVYVDKETVTTDIAEGASSLAMTAGNSFTVSLNAEKAVCYRVLANSGKFTVNVNGYDQITGAESGIINLNRGENAIKFTLTEGSATVNQVQFAQVDSFANGAYTVYALENRIPEYYMTNVSPVGFTTNGGVPSFTMRVGCWLEYDIYTEEDQYVNVSLYAASPDADGTIIAYVNGEQQIKSKGAISSGYAAFVDHQLDGFLHIPAGYSTVRIQQEMHASNIHTITFDSYDEDALFMENFRLVTEDGGRLPFVIKEGFTAYAKVDVLKLGNPTGEYRLMLAQYAEDRSLVDVSITEIDVSKMADKENKTFSAPLTYKGNGGWVKAFLVDKNTLAPQEKSIMYQDNMYFDEAVLDETVTYANATNVLNGAGEYYADYSIHNDQYDIDAIFYDSVVGDQSKVFAFIGVPKGASEENPVPAVVCVHGGNGVAFYDWVKLWNDRGYAAIAMTLTGDGPEACPASGASGSGVSQYPHPYKGQHCWGEAAFRADYENAAMYQNVLNVVRAHNLLRAWPGVDETKTGITGISWGGVTTTTVIGVDNRFKFAVPVYGCGYLDESETYFSTYFDKATNTIMWDPANFAARSTVPTLYVNSDSDEHFSINSTTKSVGVTEGSRMSIRNKYGHGYSQGWSPAEIYTFAKGMIEGYDPFITITSQKAENGKFTAIYTAPDGISAQSAVLYYITESELPYGGKDNITWNKVADGAIANGAVSFTLPKDATFCYATVTDNNGSLISSKYIEVK